MSTPPVDRPPRHATTEELDVTAELALYNEGALRERLSIQPLSATVSMLNTINDVRQEYTDRMRELDSLERNIRDILHDHANTGDSRNAVTSVATRG